MGILQDLYIKRLTQSGSLQNPPMAQYQQEDGQQPQQMPQVDTSNAIQSMAQLMGPTPAEREAQERKLLVNKRKMIAWTGLFDGLRHLGNLYYASKGATPQQYTDQPYKTIEQNYQQERQLQDYANRYSQAYAKQLFDLQRQADQDQMRREAHEAQMEWYKAREDETRNKTEREQQKAQYMENYYNAYAGKREQEAEYWRLKAQGVPDETAAKVSNYYAQAEKNRKQGEAAVTRANNTGKGSKGSSGKRGSLLPGQEGNNTQRKGSLLPK